MTDYESLRSGAGLWDRSAWHLRRFTGDTRLEFLHKYCTQEVRVDPGQGAYGCCLTVKGGLVGDVWMVVRAEDVLVVSTAAAAPGLYKHLGRYALFDKVTMDDLSATHTLRSLWGPEARSILEQVLGTTLGLGQLEHRTVEYGGGQVVVIRNDLVDTPGWDLILGLDQVAALRTALEGAGARQVDEQAITVVRVEAGLPLYGVDMDEKTIPIEAGLEERAISYDKGCYIGQEVIARIKHRGRVNRHLRGFRLSEPVETPAPLLVGDKEVGRITTCVRSPRLEGAALGLGLVHRKHMAPDTELVTGQGVTATVCELPVTMA